MILYIKLNFFKMNVTKDLEAYLIPSYTALRRPSDSITGILITLLSQVYTLYMMIDDHGC